MLPRANGVICACRLDQCRWPAPAVTADEGKQDHAAVPAVRRGPGPAGGSDPGRYAQGMGDIWDDAWAALTDHFRKLAESLEAGFPRMGFEYGRSSWSDDRPLEGSATFRRCAPQFATIPSPEPDETATAGHDDFARIFASVADWADPDRDSGVTIQITFLSEPGRLSYKSSIGRGSETLADGPCGILDDPPTPYLSLSPARIAAILGELTRFIDLSAALIAEQLRLT